MCRRKAVAVEEARAFGLESLRAFESERREEAQGELRPITQTRLFFGQVRRRLCLDRGDLEVPRERGLGLVRVGLALADARKSRAELLNTEAAARAPGQR